LYLATPLVFRRRSAVPRHTAQPTIALAKAKARYERRNAVASRIRREKPRHTQRRATVTTL